MALSVALSWLTLMELSGGGSVVPKGFRAAVVAWGEGERGISIALALLEKHGNLPLRCLPQRSSGRWKCVS